MPELDLTLTEQPDWLKGGRDAAQAWATRQQVNLASQQLALRQKELAVRLRTEQQEQTLNNLKLGEHIRQRDQLLQVEASMQALSEMVTPLLRSHNPIGAVDAILAWGSEDPIRMKHPAWQELLKGAQASVTVETARKQLDSMERLRKSQEAENVAQTRKLELEATREWLEGKPVTPGAVQKDIEFVEQFDKLTPEEKKQAQGVRLGIVGRAGVEPGETQFILKNLPEAQKAEEENPTGPLTGGILGKFKHRTPKTTEQIVEQLRAIYRSARTRSEEPAAQQSPGAVERFMRGEPAVQDNYDRFKLWLEKRK